MPRQNARPAHPLRRLLAAGCAALVLALTLASVSPAAHAWLHQDEPAHACRDHPKAKPAPHAADHNCAVVLFAHGLDLPVGPVALLPPASLPRTFAHSGTVELFLVSPRYLRQPERGPPAARVS